MIVSYEEDQQYIAELLGRFGHCDAMWEQRTRESQGDKGRGLVKKYFLRLEIVAPFLFCALFTSYT